MKLIFALIGLCQMLVYSQDLKEVEDDFDWEEAVEELTEKKALWQANDVDDYVYNLRISCFCLQCWVAPKYILVNDKDDVRYVEFDESQLDEWMNCNSSDVEKPLNRFYHTIDDLYDAAISHAEQGMDADCSNSTDGFPEAICGGSVIFEYNEDLYYPTVINLIYGPFIADAGMSYYIDCLSVFDDDDTPDTRARSTNGEYNNSCINYDGPTQVEATTTQEPDGCVCTMEYNPFCCEGNDFGNFCGAYCKGYEESQCLNHECGSCVCTEQYDPYCCGDTKYSNECFAECDSFDVDNDCYPGECIMNTTEEPIGTSDARGISIFAVKNLIILLFIKSFY